MFTKPRLETAPLLRTTYNAIQSEKLTAEFTVGEGELCLMMNPVPWLQMTT
jgi:hypothetical protein